MKRVYIILTFLLLGSSGLRAQYYSNISPIIGFRSTPNMTPSEKYDQVQGSAYFNSEWSKGVVKLKNGNTYKDLDVKFDQVEQKLIFKRADEKTFFFADPISEFQITYMADNKTMTAHFVYNSNMHAFYQVLANGTAELLKSTIKTIQSVPVFPSGTEPTNRIIEKEEYYIYSENGLTHIKIEKGDILKALDDKQRELSEYIRANNLDLKKDDELAQLIQYYNSI